ncbi:MAG: GntR family transcriptional regulator [Acidimicrobiia bacterium]|nr:GntR family transcriptional regulator [Acidimicrobiia bacterium]
MKELGQLHANLGDLVANEIRAAILAGDLKPGERLKQEQLAENMGVSRIPVREALQILEGEGLVETRPGRGSSVIELTGEAAADVLAVRGALEGLAAHLAAERVTPEVIARLRNAVEEGKQASQAGDHARASAAHTRFHLELAAAAGNSHLRTELEFLPAKTEWIVASLLQSRSEYSWQEHEAIHDAVASGDADRAEKLTRLHSQHVIESLDSD